MITTRVRFMLASIAVPGHTAASRAVRSRPACRGPRGGRIGRLGISLRAEVPEAGLLARPVQLCRHVHEGRVAIGYDAVGADREVGWASFAGARCHVERSEEHT